MDDRVDAGCESIELRKMKIDPNKFETDEKRSNPMVVAMQYPDCSINEICAYIAVGFGTVLKQCEYLQFSNNNEQADCLKDMDPTEK